MYEVLKRKKYLEECKKVFNKHDLILYKGKYPFSPSDNKGRTNIIITPQHEFVCDLLIERKILFIIEYKIDASWCNNFFCDIVAKGKYRTYDFEVDGKHHKFKKSQKKSDFRKEKHLMKNYEIFTIRIDNDLVDNYYKDKEPLEKKLKFLNMHLFPDESKRTRDIFIAREIGGINNILDKLNYEKK